MIRPVGSSCRPIGGRILCKRHPTEEASAGGIFLPDAAQMKSDRATVVETSTFHTVKGVEIPCEVEPGDEVVFLPIQADIVDGEDDYFLIHQQYIVGVLQWQAITPKQGSKTSGGASGESSDP